MKRKRNINNDSEIPKSKKLKVNNFDAIPNNIRWEKLKRLRNIYLGPTITAESRRIEERMGQPIKDSRLRNKYNNGPMKECKSLCQRLIADPKALPFLHPVTPQQAPDYHLIIEQPMSFSEVLNKLEKSQYNRVEEFYKDVKLIFGNCGRYNSPNSQYRTMSDHLEKEFENHFKIIKALSEGVELGMFVGGKRQVTVEKKVKKVTRPKVHKPKKKKKKKRKKHKKKTLKKKPKPAVTKIDDFLNDEEDEFVEIWDEEKLPPLAPAVELPPRRGGRRRNKKKKGGAMDDFIVDEDDEDLYDYFIEPPPTSAAGAAVPRKRQRAAPKALAKPKPKQKRTRKKKNAPVPGSTITDSQKNSLARIIPTLDDEQKGEILKMVQETTEEDDGSVTLDLNYIDGSTLKRMYEFCKNCAKENNEVEGSSSSDDSSDDSSDESSSDEE